jgi:hypothetical protein
LIASSRLLFLRGEKKKEKKNFIFLKQLHHNTLPVPGTASSGSEHSGSFAGRFEQEDDYVVA